jgi:hypothetical protein
LKGTPLFFSAPRVPTCRGNGAEERGDMIEEEDRIATEELIDEFVSYWVASGKSEVTARKYARYLWNICEGFEKGIEYLTTTDEDRKNTLSHFDEFVVGRPNCLESYKTAFRQYCEFMRNKTAIQSSEKGLLTIPKEDGRLWYREIRVDDVKKLQGILSSGNLRRNRHWVFRGQGDALWALEPSLGRVVYKNGKIQGFGKQLIAYERKSMWMFGRYASKDIEYRDFKGLNLLSLMQHYGCKTRLLDFSLSPFVALFVALEQYEMIANARGEANDLNIALWAIDMNAICKVKNNDDWESEAIRAFEQGERIIAGRNDFSEAGVTVVFPTICNNRISAQDGLFIMPNNLNYSFEENLCKTLEMGHEYFVMRELSSVAELRQGLDGSIIKFVIGYDKVGEIKELLLDANVTARTVYPDLIGLGKYVGGLIK